MKNLDLNSLTLKELQRLEALAEMRVAEREERERKALIHKLAEIAERGGISLNDLYEQSVSSPGGVSHRQESRVARPRRRIEPKYQHPTGQQTWSGRGKQPIWVRDYLASGKPLSDLLIRKEAEGPEEVAT